MAQAPLWLAAARRGASFDQLIESGVKPPQEKAAPVHRTPESPRPRGFNLIFRKHRIHIDRTFWLTVNCNCVRLNARGVADVMLG